jgi:hypothetical protein
MNEAEEMLYNLFMRLPEKMATWLYIKNFPVTSGQWIFFPAGGQGILTEKTSLVIVSM